MLSGSLPTQLGALSKLSVLNAYASPLSGAMPTQLGALTNLSELWVCRQISRYTTDADQRPQPALAAVAVCNVALRVDADATWRAQPACGHGIHRYVDVGDCAERARQPHAAFGLGYEQHVALRYAADATGCPQHALDDQHGHVSLGDDADANRYSRSIGTIECRLHVLVGDVADAARRSCQRLRSVDLQDIAIRDNAESVRRPRRPCRAACVRDIGLGNNTDPDWSSRWLSCTAQTELHVALWDDADAVGLSCQPDRSFRGPLCALRHPTNGARAADCFAQDVRWVVQRTGLANDATPRVQCRHSRVHVRRIHGLYRPPALLVLGFCSSLDAEAEPRRCRRLHPV